MVKNKPNDIIEGLVRGTEKESIESQIGDGSWCLEKHFTSRLVQGGEEFYEDSVDRFQNSYFNFLS